MEKNYHVYKPHKREFDDFEVDELNDGFPPENI